MHDLAGLLGPRGCAPDTACLDRLQHSLGDRLPSATYELVVADEVCFLRVAARPPRPEPVRDGLLIGWDGRLDNRAGLDSALGISGEHGSDADRVAWAYRRWGVSFCEHLIGDYALALWDSNRHRLLLARDPMGVRPLFYARSAAESALVWGSTLRTVIAAQVAANEVDEQWVAEYLVHAMGAERTPYRAVRAVAPGHVLTVEDGVMRSLAFWMPDRRPKIRLPDDRAYEQRFAQLFVEAVRCRLDERRPVMAELSGGLDSSSIACVASALIRQQQVEATDLLTVSWVYPRSRTADERRYVGYVHEHIGRAGIYLDDDDGLAFDGLDQPDYEYPTAFECVRVREQHRGELMASRGVRVLLSGFGGDNVTFSEFEATLPLADLLWSGRLTAFLRLLGTWHRVDRTPYPALAWGSLTRSCLPSWAERQVRVVRADLLECLDADFVRRTRLVERLAGFVADDSPGPPSRRRQIAAVRMATSTVSWMYDSGRWPYLVTYPFLHLPLVDFCLGVPTEQFIRPGQTRSLHRRALRDRLPPEIVARRDKRGPDEAIQRSLASSWPRIQAWLGDPEVVRRGWINDTAFRRMIDLARFGRQRTELVFILRTIALEAWLRRQSG